MIVVCSDDRTALNPVRVDRWFVDDAQGGTGFAGRALFAVVDGERVRVSEPRRQGPTGEAPGRPRSFDGETGVLFVMLVDWLGGGNVDDDPVFRVSWKAPLARDEFEKRRPR